MEAGEGGWLVILGGLVTAAAGAAVKLWTGFRQGRRADRADALGEWREIVVRQQEQIERQDAVIRQGQDAIRLIQEEAQECREDYAVLAAAVRFLHGLLRQDRQTLKAMGHDMGDLPELPEIRQRRRLQEADFQVRQVRQSAELVQEAAQVLPKPPKPKTP